MSIVNVEALKQNGCQLWWPGQVASSNAPKAITAAGDAKQILPFPGAGIGMFDGTGDFIELPNHSDFDFGTSLWTIECYCYIKDYSSTTKMIFRTPYGDTGYGSISIGVTTSGKIASGISLDGSTWVNASTIVWASTLSVNTIYHIALVRRADGYVKGYINGVEDFSYNLGVSSSLVTPNRTIKIGYGSSGDNLYFNGNLSEFRVSSVARYTANFTPPRRQLESDEHTKLLIHFNRNDTTFIDSSPSAHTITAYGNAKQLCSPCGSGVAYFDGSRDYLIIPDSDDWFFGTNDFTIEFWYCPLALRTTVGGSLFEIRTTEYVSPLVIFHDYSGNNNTYGVMFSWDWTVSRAMKSTTSAAVGRWDHFALVRQGSTFKLFLNGVVESTYTSSNSIGNSGDPLYIGGVPFRADASINGLLCNYRISKYIARYTSNFTPQTTPFAPDPYTKLLLHMDGVGNAFYDSSDPPGDNGFPILPDGVTVTPSGTFTTQKMKDGRNIWKFNGSTNYITISDHASWSMFTSDFTIVAWVKFDSIAANRTIIGQYTDTNNQWFVRWTTSNVIQLYGITSSTARFDFTCPLTPVAGTWYHVVIQRSGSSCVMYINGVAQTVTQTTAFSATATDIAAVLSIGKINTEYQAGNIKDLQIFTKALTMDQISALYQETYIY
jgi:hypothetical protein